MTTIVYVNPNYTTNGDGSARTEALSNGGVGARLTLPATLTSGNTYYVWGGGASLVVTAQTAMAANTEVITDPDSTEKAVIDGSGSTSSFSLFRMPAANCRIKNLKLILANATSSHGAYPSSSGASNITFTGNEVYGPSNSAYDCRGIALTDLDNGPIVIANNYFTGVRYSMSLDIDYGATSKSCEVYGNTFGEMIGTGSTAGDEEKCIASDSARTEVDWNYLLLIHDNIFTGFGEYAIDLASAKKAKIYNNIFRDQNSRGELNSAYAICCGSNAKGGQADIHNNFIYLPSAGGGISTRGSSDNLIYGNVIDSKVGISILSMTTNSNNNAIYHNTIISSIAYRCIDITNGTGHLIENNVLDAGAGRAIHLAAATTGTWSNNVYVGTAVDLGTLTDGGGNINADPLLSSDYKPKSGSPCIGAGTYALPGATDYRGLAYRHDGPTIGAFEMNPKVMLRA